MTPTLLLTLMLLSQAPAAADLNETLWEAARAGDVARIAAALDKGADVNAKARYNVTALIFAATNGHVEAVRLLVSRGADINAQDTFYRARAVDMALSNGHTSAAIVLLESGSLGAEGALMFGVQTDNRTLVEAALSARTSLSRRTLEAALARAEREKRAALVPLLKAALDARPADSSSAFAVDPATLPRFAGAYRDASSGFALTVTVQDGALVGQAAGQPSTRLVPTAENVFRVVEANATLTFNGKEGVIDSISLVQGPVTMTLTRVPAEAAAAAPAPAPVTPKPAAPTSVPSSVSSSKPRNWPSFRGDAASGNGDGQRVVSEWDVASGKNIKWKTPIPGIANASPIVWGNRVFVTTAISKAGDTTFRTGPYGDVKPVEDLSEHTWKVYCLDKTTGKVLWEQVAFTGTPKVKRHTKGTQANSTPVTDGRRVVAAFGSAGIARRLGYEWQRALACGSRDSRQRMVFRSDLSMGAREFSNHLPQQRDPSGRPAEGVVHCGLGSRQRKRALEHGTGWRNFDVGHAGHRSKRHRARGDHHQRHEDSWLRPGNRKAAVDAWSELGGHGGDAGCRPWSRVRHRRLSTGTTCLRDPSGWKW